MTMWGARLLERYIVVATSKALGLVSVGLTTLFSLLEFVDQLHDVGKGHYRLIDAFVYVLLTAPERLLQLMPAAMLFACLFALGSLASRSELTAMRAGGVSPHRIVGSVFKLAGCTVVALFLLAQFVIPPTQQLAQAQRASRLSASEAVRSGNSFWAAGDHQFLNVRRFDNGNTPSDIYLYEFAASGELETLIQADHAEVRPDGTWLLEEVSRKRFSVDRSAAEGIPRSADGATRGNTRIETDRLASLVWHPFLRPRQASVLILPANSMQPIELYQYVRDLERRGQPAARYAQELWAKIDLPLAMAAMILIAAPFVFGPLRTRGAGQRMMIGTMIGIVFSLIQQITIYLGQLLNLSPALTETGPSVVLMALALYLFRRAVA
jgi:lipopolysaccharide export system permease protein